MKFRVLWPLLASLLVLSVLGITGCGGGTPDEPEKPGIEKPTPDEPNNPHEPNVPDIPHEPIPVAGLSFNSITLSNDGDSFACPIHGLEAGTWSIECEQSWCKTNIKDNVLRIEVEPNTETDKRTTVVTIRHSSKAILGHITIYQSSQKESAELESTTTTKNSFFPLFSATWCPYSPDMDKTLEEIQKRWKHPILPMRIHVKDSELYTPLSEDFSILYDNWSTPTGYFENFFKVQNLSDGIVSVANFWNLIMANTSTNNSYTDNCSSIGCKASMSEDVITADISLDPFVPGQYRLLAFILEDKIIAPQKSKEEGEIFNYCHNSVLVGALTPAVGQEFDLKKPQKIISISGALPRNSNLSNLRLLVVLERNSTKLNYSDECWYADNCLSVPLGKAIETGNIENLYVGEEIEN